MEEEDLRGGSDAVALKRPAEVMWRRSHLHVQLGVVDEILQGVSTRVEVLELCVVGDGAHGGVMWPDHPADVDWLDVGEVGEYSRPRCAGGLQSCTADIRSQPTCSEPPQTSTIQYKPGSCCRRRFPLWWESWISPPVAPRTCPASRDSWGHPGCGWGSVGSRCIPCKWRGRSEGPGRWWTCRKPQRCRCILTTTTWKDTF